MIANKQQRIVVTGATGLIGQRLVTALVERGAHVIAFVRNVQRDRERLPRATEHVEWNGNASDGNWNNSIDGADAIINLAGAPIAVRWNNERKKTIYDSRILGTRHIVQAIRRARRKPAVLVQGSAVGYYGASTAGPVTEQAQAGNDFMGTVCRDWELEALTARELGLRVVPIRTGIVLDTEGGALEKILPAFRLFLGGPFAPGMQPFPWIHIDDEVRILLHALDSQTLDEPLNAVAPGIVTTREFARILGNVLHRPSLFTVPQFVISLVLGEASITVTKGQHVIPERTLASGFTFQFSQLGPALRNILDR